MKIDYSELYSMLKVTPLEPWIEQLPEKIAHGLRVERHGRMPEWEEALAQLPNVGGRCFVSASASMKRRPPLPKEDVASKIELRNEIRVDGSPLPELASLLMPFHPWRKGPYHIHGVHIDTEWRSDWKWDRVRPHLQPLENRTILDVGCGNGYHCWRMAGEGAKLVVGIDPSPLFICQFFAMKNFIQNPKAWVLPLGIEDLPEAPGAFDTVFSMGVLYHRKDPMEHVDRLKAYLRPRGQLVIETLVVDGPEGHVLIPEGRYAKMRNVWNIPSVATLEKWMREAGMKEVKVVDECVTTTEEQRATEWMTFESLPDFLDPSDSSITAEGHPAPKRAVVVATA
jgi:tRNA (mo5U34)-methyltransferase